MIRWCVATLVLLAHGLAVATLLVESGDAPPVLKSAPPLYGSLVEPAPAPKPAEVRPARVTPQPTPQARASLPVPEPEFEPESVAPPTPDSPAPAAPPHSGEPEQAAQATVIPPRVDARGRENPPPEYPARSRRAGEQGTVVLAIRIDQAGRVTDVRVATSSGFPRLDEAARKAVWQWRYEPARRAGRAISFDYRQPVVFALDGGGR